MSSRPSEASALASQPRTSQTSFTPSLLDLPCQIRPRSYQAPSQDRFSVLAIQLGSFKSPASCALFPFSLACCRWIRSLIDTAHPIDFVQHLTTPSSRPRWSLAVYPSSSVRPSWTSSPSDMMLQIPFGQRPLIPRQACAHCAHVL